MIQIYQGQHCMDENLIKKEKSPYHSYYIIRRRGLL